MYEKKGGLRFPITHNTIVEKQLLACIRAIGDHKPLRASKRCIIRRQRLQRGVAWHIREHGQAALSALIMSAARSAIMMVGVFVLPEVMVGMTEASTTCRPSSALNFRR